MCNVLVFYFQNDELLTFQLQNFQMQNAENLKKKIDLLIGADVHKELKFGTKVGIIIYKLGKREIQPVKKASVE